ncbi:hypothetical protein BC829DRAFT_403356 [Chytridium lagenaria]|nr:hypothetical protein BC829DRAFT_403356 [Chytridium lagenaria]
MPAPSTSAMEVDVQASPQSLGNDWRWKFLQGRGVNARWRMTVIRQQASKAGFGNSRCDCTASNQASGLVNTESYMEDVVVEATNLVLVNDQPANEPLETVVPPPAFIENVDDHSGERPSSSRSRKPSLRQTTLKLRDRTVAGAKHTYRTAIQTRSKTRSSPYAR